MGLRAVRALQSSSGMISTRTLLVAMLATHVPACMVGDEFSQDDGTDDGGGIQPDVAGDPTHLNIGFNDGHVDEFQYYPDFFNASSIRPGPRLCHAYIGWHVGLQAPHSGSVTDQGAREYIDNWFAQAQGNCDDALIAFQAYTHGNPPSVSDYAAAVDAFAKTNWAAEAGFTGHISIAPWNEPNNGGDAGDGLGAPLDARLAARYYLAVERTCRANGCTAVAGDFATNGNMWDDLEWNCANDNVSPSQLCNQKSNANPSGQPASYLDRYKNEIVNKAQSFGLPSGFRPAVFAYHGWHDSNEYINTASHCSSYGDCALRRVLRALGGSWAGVVIWNTEDGIGQDVPISDGEQACGAAFMMRLLTISNRVHRVYITRLHGGGGQLLVDHNTRRPAFGILANRQTQVPGGNCN
jgi:hypothetical protein